MNGLTDNTSGQPSLLLLLGDFTLREVFDQLKAGANPNYPMLHERIPPLMLALQDHVFPELIDMLLEFGASALAVDEKGQGVLARFLIGHGLSDFIGSKEEEDQVAVTAVVDHLMRHGAPVDLPDEHGFTPLMRLCQRVDQPYLAELLVKYGANINARNAMGHTPLCFAASHRAQYHMIDRLYGTRTVRYLLESGADISYQAPDGYSPLVAAIQAGNPSVVSVLLEAGASTVAPISYRHLEPIFAVIAHDLPRLEVAQEQGLSLDVRNAVYQTPLMWAAMVGDHEAAQYLLDNKANPNARDLTGWTPLVYAVDEGNEAICALLLDKGANPNYRIEQTNTYGEQYTILNWAFDRNMQDPEQQSHHAICHLLLSHGATSEEMLTGLMKRARIIR